MTRSDGQLIADALQHLSVLHTHLTRGDRADQTIADAVSLRLAATIEALANCSDALRRRAFGDGWPLMWATRNRIAHGYAFVDMSIVAATVERDLPWLEACLQLEAARLAPD